MKIHVIAVGDVPVQRENPACAFTTKAVHLSSMLRMRGHHVTLYGPAGSDPAVADVVVPCISKAMLAKAHPFADTDRYQMTEGNRAEVYAEFCKRVRYEIPHRTAYGQVEPVCLVAGWLEDAARWLGPQNPVVESGIGYNHTRQWTKYHVFESYAWLHYMWGVESKGVWRNGNPWDVVIPNAFDPTMFTASLKRGDYALFMGRINEDKGWRLALQACHATGLPLKIVGQLPTPNFDESAFFKTVQGHGATWQARAGIAERRELMGRAKVFFCPTQYCEPFGGVAVEAMLSGCPIITSDWGAFSETVVQGMTGFRCRGVGEMIDALALVDAVSRPFCREYAIRNYSLERISNLYHLYLSNVVDDASGKATAYSMLPLPCRWMGDEEGKG